MNEQQRKAMELALEMVQIKMYAHAEMYLKEALAQPELCKYGQERKSCTSNPMDCQCALDAALAQDEEQ